jgi:hypothetical protein
MVTSIGFFQRNTDNMAENIHRLSRDHKISVYEAIKNNYEPYYITHPINCEIMPWIENNKKKTKSSLKYDDLVRMVDEYDHKVIYSTSKCL